MNIEALKENVQKWYFQAAQFFLFQNVLMYFFACIIAHEPLGLPGYIGFLYHCCQWVER